MISACCPFVSIYTIFDVPCLICSLKWCHLMEICFVWGLYFSHFSNSVDYLVSSKVVVYELHESHFIPNKLDTSNIIRLNGIKFLMLWLRLIYSASVVDKAISIFLLLTQTIEQFVNLIMYPVLEKIIQLDMNLLYTMLQWNMHRHTMLAHLISRVWKLNLYLLSSLNNVQSFLQILHEIVLDLCCNLHIDARQKEYQV